MKRWALILAGLTAIAAVLWTSQCYVPHKHGFYLQRLSKDTIRVSWGTPSGADINPRHTLSFIFGQVLKYPEEIGSLMLSRENGVWMYPNKLTTFGAAAAAAVVNPKNKNPIKRMFSVIEMKQQETNSDAEFTRIVDDHYVYLGWAVLSDEDFLHLTELLADRSEIDVSADLQSAGSTFFRLNDATAKKLNATSNPNNSVQELKAKIPFVFERIDRRQGHPQDVMHVLFLDGTIEAIPIGDRFPATEAVVEFFSTH